MNWKIPLFKTYWDQKDIDAVTRVITRGTSWTNGPEVSEFESSIARFLGIPYALAFNSGTSALHAALCAHHVEGGEVIIPSFTFIATANAVILAGAKPVFADIESDTLALDAQDVEKKITSKTKAIMPIHYGGFPARDSIKLQEIAKKHNIALIEDAAESLGSHINGKMVGTFGDTAMFSLCQNKVISTGEGGILVTKSRDTYEKAKLLRSHGRFEKDEDYFFSIGESSYLQVGFNYRMSSIAAALGVSQLGKIKHTTDLRRTNAHYLTSKLSHMKLQTPIELPYHFAVYQMYSIRLPDKVARNALQKHLAQNEIMSKVYFDPIHKKSLYNEDINLTCTQQMSERVLTIPLYPTQTREELDLIIKCIGEVC
ncbi:MAG TPA: DegT/DnrJ/EryC1/StrS family aminotransferase [Candidatus Nanoarchaeia archaeon]|nr:DegT/DnrJ/EryC1/StrS family aminotransferase [Candidatus Nanoarchaeia archaeon]